VIANAPVVVGFSEGGRTGASSGREAPDVPDYLRCRATHDDEFFCAGEAALRAADLAALETSEEAIWGRVG
jgi:hypothetical protein